MSAFCGGTAKTQRWHESDCWKMKDQVVYKRWKMKWWPKSDSSAICLVWHGLQQGAFTGDLRSPDICLFMKEFPPFSFLSSSLTIPSRSGLLWSSFHTWNILYWRKGAGGRDDNDDYAGDDDDDDKDNVNDKDDKSDVGDSDDADDAGVFPSALLGFYCFWGRCFCCLPLHLGIPRLAGTSLYVAGKCISLGSRVFWINFW